MKLIRSNSIIKKKILTENSSNLVKGIESQNQIPYRINPKKSVTRHVVKLWKTKDRTNLESHQKKRRRRRQHPYNRETIRMTGFTIRKYAGQKDVAHYF